jgi:hypothetical protein
MALPNPSDDPHSPSALAAGETREALALFEHAHGLRVLPAALSGARPGDYARALAERRRELRAVGVGGGGAGPRRRSVEQFYDYTPRSARASAAAPRAGRRAAAVPPVPVGRAQELGDNDRYSGFGLFFVFFVWFWVFFVAGVCVSIAPCLPPPDVWGAVSQCSAYLKL